MFLIIAVILLLLWLAGFTLTAVGGLIHILLVLAVISILWHFFFGRSRRSI